MGFFDGFIYRKEKKTTITKSVNALMQSHHNNVSIIHAVEYIESKLRARRTVTMSTYDKIIAIGKCFQVRVYCI